MTTKNEWTPKKSMSTEKCVNSIIAKLKDKPNAFWVYLNADRSIHHFRLRYDQPDGTKKILPYTHGTLNGVTDWFFKGPNEPFPLYNLPEILDRKDDPVLFVEGEKAADAAKILFPDFVITTTSGGCTSSSKTDFKPLDTRDTRIWPDNDKAGQKYAEELIESLKKVNVNSIHQVQIPEHFPSKWDVANELPQGESIDSIRAFLSEAKEKYRQEEIGALKTICMSDVVPEDIAWLWNPYIARGTLTMLDGDPGLGKSHITLAIASALSKGEPLPASDEKLRGITLIVSCEDDLSYSVKPRLMKMEAVCDYIHAYPELFTLDSEGLSKLRKTVERIKPDLIVIDPVFAYLGAGVDTNAANKVRAILAPLTKLATDANCAIVCVRHLNKCLGKQTLLYRGIGSIDFVAAARSGLTVLQSPDDESVRIILHTKTNIGPKGQSLGFTFEGGSFKWLGLQDISEQDFLEREPVQSQQKKNKGMEVENFLKLILVTGPQESKVVNEKAIAMGISKSSLNRAKERLGIISTKGKGESQSWTWSLPNYEHQFTLIENDEDLEIHENITDVPDIDGHLQYLQDIQDTHTIYLTDHEHLKSCDAEGSEK